MPIQDKAIRSTGWKTDFLIGFPDGLYLLFFSTLLIQALDLSVQEFYNLNGWIALAGTVLVMITAWQANRGDGQHDESSLSPQEKRKLQRLDISEEMIGQIGREQEQDALLWEKTLQQEQVQLTSWRPLQALRSALVAGAFFLLGGLIAFWPYLANEQFEEAASLSISLVLLSTLIFAYLKAKMTGQHAVPVILRYLLRTGAIWLSVYIINRVVN